MQRNAFVVIVALLGLGVGLLVWRAGRTPDAVTYRADGSRVPANEARDGLTARSGSSAGSADAAGGAAARSAREHAGAADGGPAGAPDAATSAAAFRERLAQARRVGASTGTGLPTDGSAEVEAAAPGAERTRGVRPERTVQADASASQLLSPETAPDGEAVPEVAYDSGTEKRFVTETQVELPDVGKISGDAGTMSFWVKPDWQSEDQGDATFLQIGDSGLHMTKNVTYLRFEFFDQQGKEQGLGFYIGDWKPGEWHQVTGTWLGGQYVLFVDGKAVSRNTFANPPDFQDETRLYAGSVSTNTAPSPAEMSHIKYLNRPMTLDEVTKLFEATDRPR